MESRTAKRRVAKIGGELVFDKDSKIWTLTVAGNSTEIGSENLKNMDDEVLQSEIDGLIAMNDNPELVADADVEHEAPASKRSAYPVKVITGVHPKRSEALKVTLPDGTVIDGIQNANYCFFVDGGSNRVCRKSWAGDRYSEAGLNLA